MQSNQQQLTFAHTPLRFTGICSCSLTLLFIVLLTLEAHKPLKETSTLNVLITHSIHEIKSCVIILQTRQKTKCRLYRLYSCTSATSDNLVSANNLSEVLVIRVKPKQTRITTKDSKTRCKWSLT